MKLSNKLIYNETFTSQKQHHTWAYSHTQTYVHTSATVMPFKSARPDDKPDAC